MVWFRKRYIIYVILLLVACWWSMRITGFDLRQLVQLGNMFEMLATRFFPIEWSLLPRMAYHSIVTLAVAFLGSLLALLIALPVSFLAAQNTSGSIGVYGTSRFVLSGLRSIPEIVFGLLFVTVLGLGPFAAVLAIILHNIGVLGKLIAELIESADPGPQEAMKSIGATKWVANLFAILPQIWPNVLSHYFYRFEVAIRTSLILGFIGGGGIGQQLFNHFQSFYYTAVALDIICIMALVLLVDFIGGRIRARVI
ncbi:phosphonate ABC transporter, permease protein PhnE [Alkalihalobacillus oceani]|uniref:phosphonate ABC transporter, permease protein PhnE n=1 Tax=Halalkalibacter oceani TaxID=1653776 RepID=UPI00203D4F44|nr:phosphonate ABC transporter, permease protein PhnE [Halalkalibacter oceani]MCM3761457.1 phosphonate ABC transporter, permease protein PhnE [Halalkalibacter oceani]